MSSTPTISGYADLRPIGTGGIGDVYRATQVATGATVAIKVLRDVTDRSVAWHRTRRELHALRALGGHPNVIQVIDVLHDSPGLVMDHAPGGSVATLLARRGPTLPLPEVVLIGRDTAAALRAAHEQGIIHRDVKPQNLLIDGGGRIRLCDFGIASLTRSDEFRTRTSARSMRYASPEDLEEDAPVGPATDVYSLGATLVHLLHGSPPTLKDRLSPRTPARTDDPHRDDLEQLVAACVHPDPACRPSPDEFLDRITAIHDRLPAPCTSLPVVSTVPPGDAASIDDATIPRDDRPSPSFARPDQRADDTTRRRWAVVANPQRVAAAVLVAAVLVAAGGLLAARMLRSEPDRDDADITTSPRPAGLVPLDDPTVVWPTGEVGECLVQDEGRPVLRVVDCTAPHDLQRFHVGIVELPDREHGPVVDRFVENTCLTEAPVTPADSLVRIAVSGPSPTTWADGDRGYECFLGVPGRRISGSTLD